MKLTNFLLLNFSLFFVGGSTAGSFKSPKFNCPQVEQQVAQVEGEDHGSRDGSAIDDLLPDVKIPPGFLITRVADDTLATNIYRMAGNPRGDVFVSGPGYIRRLVDDNGDGHFDRSIVFAEWPRSGSQGLFCADDFILAVGDDGVWQFDDKDWDGVADNEPKQRLKIGTGGEHFAHQIKRGPDGWYYLIAGNQTTIEPRFSSGPFSPIRFPRAGFLMRISPDFSMREVVAHGFRNAYDFDFNDQNEIFLYDSDDEREVGLPWYRPTRLFQIHPGDDAGWINDGWKRPSHFFDMPIEIGAVGRGSPTGVVCYRNDQFPIEYRNAIFIADWTFGRILVAPRDLSSGTYLAPVEFAKAEGDFGFAITDLLIDRDGSLLISVGGRNTSGSVYRIRYDNSSTVDSPTVDRIFPKWDVSIPTELQRIARERSAWSNEDLATVLRSLAPFSVDEGKQIEIQRFVLQSLIGRGKSINRTVDLHPLLSNGLQASLRKFDPIVAKLVRQLGHEVDSSILRNIDMSKVAPFNQYLLRYLQLDNNESQMRLISVILESLSKSLRETNPISEAELLAMVRLCCLTAGDFGESQSEMAFRGYTFNEPFDMEPPFQNLVAGHLVGSLNVAVAQQFDELAVEIGRIAALLKLHDTALQRLLLAQIQTESNPVEDLHWLFCLSKTGIPNDEMSHRNLATIIHSIKDKFQAAQIRTDRNWEPRVQSLIRGLVQLTPPLADLLLEEFSGKEEQVFLLPCLPERQKEIGIDRLAALIAQDPPRTSLPQLQALFASGLTQHQSVFRLTASIANLQELSILALTRLPANEDRQWYQQALFSRNVTLVKHGAIALRRLGTKPNPENLVSAYVALTRLNWSEQHSSVRDQLVLLLIDGGLDVRDYQSKSADVDQSPVVNQWRGSLHEKFPAEFAKLIRENDDWLTVYRQVDWSQGDLLKGKGLYEELKCAQCHQGNLAIGPTLEGVAHRFSRDDLFRIIAQPSERISDRYRAKVILLTDGTLHVGIPIYESVDGITIQDAMGRTIRVNAEEIESVRDSNQSLMPDGLLEGLTPNQFADLAAFLQSLGRGN